MVVTSLSGVSLVGTVISVHVHDSPLCTAVSFERSGRGNYILYVYPKLCLAEQQNSDINPVDKLAHS